MPPSGNQTRASSSGRTPNRKYDWSLPRSTRAAERDAVGPPPRGARSGRSPARPRRSRARTRSSGPNLMLLVAAHARVGRAARAVLGDEVVDHRGAERGALVDHVDAGCRGARRPRARPRCRAGRSSGRRCWPRCRARRRAAASRRRRRSPRSTSSAAAVDESTPPDMATTTRRRPTARARLSRRRGPGPPSADTSVRDVVDLGLGVVAPEAEADRLAPPVAREPERQQAPATAPATPRCRPRPSRRRPPRGPAPRTSCPATPAKPTLSVPGTRGRRRRGGAAPGSASSRASRRSRSAGDARRSLRPAPRAAAPGGDAEADDAGDVLGPRRAARAPDVPPRPAARTARRAADTTAPTPFGP